MPGLFSWRARLRSRKTPESQKVAVTSNGNNNVFHEKDAKRAVRFNDGVGRNKEEIRQPPVGWKPREEPPKTTMAPLARDEVLEIPRGETSPSPPNTMGSIITHASETVVRPLAPNTRTAEIRKDEVPSESESSGTLRASNNNKVVTPPSTGVVFLEVDDEVKRTPLPSVLTSIETVRALFLRAFPQLTVQYINLPQVKIYIQEPSKGQLFYELDDISDIKNGAVLKLREQNSGFQSPPPAIRYSSRTPTDYLSESENEIMDFRGRNTYRGSSYRSASAMDGRMYAMLSVPPKPSRSPVPSRYDPYYDPYASDTSSHDARSGSVTPVVDKEARFRMETMERQLAGLSSLVHSALVSKGMSESSQRDMQQLRKEILALHPDVNSMSSLPSSAEPSLPDTASVNDETLHQLQKLRRQVMDAQSQIRSIRRNVQMNAQSSRDILHDAFNQIRRLIEEHSLGAATATKKASNIMDKLKADHTEQLVCLQQSLQSFEEDVEEVRKLVLNTNRKLRMSEVEAFTAALTKIGRNAARLKTSFPSLQRELESKIRTDMEDVLRTEKFVKHESAQIDDCLRRCKTLANMMVTMKKLAMVQDPGLTAYRNDRTEKILNDDGMQKPNNISVSERALPVRDTVIRDIQNSEEAEVSQTEPPPVPPSPTNYQAPSTSQKKDDSHVLDSLLDELTVSPSREKSVSPSSVKSERISRSVPPKPPERYSTFDARRRYTPSIVQEFRRQAMSTPVDGPLVVTSTIYKRPQMTTATAANSTIRMPPVAISTTDAIDDETTKTVNASSSDSVNSQEGNRVRSIIMIERQQHSAQQQQQQREMQNHTLQKKPASVA